MDVFVLFHADLEDDRYVRGVFATRELAEAALTMDETGVYPASLRQHERFWQKTHNDFCCSVEETPLETTLPSPFVLNPQPPFTDSFGISAAFAIETWSALVRESFVSSHQPAFDETARK